jgi:hypothetical protein
MFLLWCGIFTDNLKFDVLIGVWVFNWYSAVWCAYLGVVFLLILYSFIFFLGFGVSLISCSLVVLRVRGFFIDILQFDMLIVFWDFYWYSAGLYADLGVGYLLIFWSQMCLLGCRFLLIFLSLLWLFVCRLFIEILQFGVLIGVWEFLLIFCSLICLLVFGFFISLTTFLYLWMNKISFIFRQLQPQSFLVNFANN